MYKRVSDALEILRDILKLREEIEIPKEVLLGVSHAVNQLALVEKDLLDQARRDIAEANWP